MIYKCDPYTGVILERFDCESDVCSTSGQRVQFQRALDNDIRTYKGYSWCYSENYNDTWIEEHMRDANFQSKKVKREYRKSYYVIGTKVSDGKKVRFRGRAECAKFFGCGQETITNRIKDNKPLQGYTLEWD